MTRCACTEHINSMYLPWDPYLVPNYQLRYSSVTKFKYYPILGKHYNWVIMNFIEKVRDMKQYKKYVGYFLHIITNGMVNA